jgi:hypothetical protein
MQPFLTDTERKEIHKRSPSKNQQLTIYRLQPGILMLSFQMDPLTLFWISPKHYSLGEKLCPIG